MKIVYTQADSLRQNAKTILFYCVNLESSILLRLGFIIIPVVKTLEEYYKQSTLPTSQLRYTYQIMSPQRRIDSLLLAFGRH